MFAKSWRFIIPLILIAGCGEKPEVKVADVKPVMSKEEAGKPVTGDWLIIHSLSDPEQLNPLTSSDAVFQRDNRIYFRGFADPRSA